MDKLDKEYERIIGFREDFNWETRFMIQEQLHIDGRVYFVSTVDLGLDHNLCGIKPLYYETMIFDVTTVSKSGRDIYMDRYSTKEEAETAHKIVINKLKKREFTIEDDYITFKGENI